MSKFEIIVECFFAASALILIGAWLACHEVRHGESIDDYE